MKLLNRKSVIATKRTLRRSIKPVHLVLDRSIEENSSLVTFDSEDESDQINIKKMVLVEDTLTGVSLLVDNLKK